MKHVFTCLSLGMHRTPGAATNWVDGKGGAVRAVCLLHACKFTMCWIVKFIDLRIPFKNYVWIDAMEKKKEVLSVLALNPR